MNASGRIQKRMQREESPSPFWALGESRRETMRMGCITKHFSLSKYGSFEGFWCFYYYGCCCSCLIATSTMTLAGYCWLFDCSHWLPLKLFVYLCFFYSFFLRHQATIIDAPSCHSIRFYTHRPIKAD